MKPADRIAELEEALREVKDAIVRADPEVLTDTLWMPEDVLMGATVVDRIDIALEASAAPSVDEDESTPSPAELEAAQLRSMLRRVLLSFEMHYSSLYPKLDLANVSPDSLIGEARAMVGRNPRTGEPKHGQD